MFAYYGWTNIKLLHEKSLVLSAESVGILRKVENYYHWI